MEQTKISMFDRFDLISHIMPYYAQTHKAFLLLSSLCSASRSKLNEFYDEFINCMKGNWLYIKRFYNEIKLVLPSDLFIVRISIETESDMNNFVQFIKNYEESKVFKLHSIPFS